MADLTSISLSVTAEDLKPWMPQIAELYVTLDLRLGWDAYLSALLSRSRSPADFTALLERIALNPAAFHTLTQHGGYPPAGEWVTVRQIAKWLGKHKSWVQSQLSEHFPDVGELRLTWGNNQSCSHYSPSVLPKLKRLATQYPPAGSWLTVPCIAGLVQRNEGWVRCTLAEHFPDVGEVRLMLHNNQPCRTFAL